MRLLQVLLVELITNVAADLAFVAPGQAVNAVNVRSPPVQDFKSQTPKADGNTANTAILLGASAVLLALCRRQGLTSRNVWSFIPMYKEDEWPGLGDDSTGSQWRSHQNLRRQTYRMMGRKIRYMKQQKVLRESNVWWASYGKWNVDCPNPIARTMYEGPQSHPDNPDFPRPNTGLPALGGGAMSCSMRRTGSTLAGAAAPSAKRAVFSTRVRSSLVRHAHKKAAASTKNQGHTLRPHFWGVKALNGKAVKCRQLLVKQKGMNWYPGENVMRCKNDSLIALKDGIVQWRGEYRHKEISVVPWEYVRAKCRWRNAGNLAPQEYQPWMGHRNYETQQMFTAWSETDEGKAWAEKKAEKIAKQKEIQKKIRAKKQWRWKDGAKEKVAAGDSDSESEK